MERNASPVWGEYSRHRQTQTTTAQHRPNAARTQPNPLVVRAEPCGSVAGILCIVFRVERLQLRLVRLPLVAFFETSFGRVYDKTFILLSLAGDGAEGLGECVADVDPYSTAETNVTAWHVIKDFLAPLVLGRTFEHPRDLFPSLARVRGPNMAKAAIEMAAWDLAARLQHRPLSPLLGGPRPA